MNLAPLYDAFKNISLLLRNSDIYQLGEETQELNCSQDVKKVIDIETNKLIINALSKIPEIIGYISEEENDFKLNPERKNGYVIIFDPLDGSRNVSANISVGTIYGIYEYDVENDNITSIIETGYVLYGHSTILVKTAQDKVKLYHLDSEHNFVYKRSMCCSTKGEIYAINDSYQYDKDIKDLVFSLKNKGYTQRWTGTMVADCHNILLNGGIFIYPATDKKPQGKIRFLYEALPFAHIFNLIGGRGVDTNLNNILDKLEYVKLKQNNIHKSITIILCTQGIYESLSYLREINEDIN